MILRQLVLTLVLCLVAPNVYADIGTSTTDTVSRRISTCQYKISFAAGSDGPNLQAKALIRAAAYEGLARPTRHFNLVSFRLPDETDELKADREDRITGLLLSYGVSLRDIDRTPINYTRTDAPAVEINICAPGLDPNIVALGRNLPDETVHFTLANEEFFIPLKYLGAYFWQNRPYEALEVGFIWLEFGWPGLEPQNSDSMLTCLDSPSETCKLHRINVVIEPIHPDIAEVFTYPEYLGFTEMADPVFGMQVLISSGEFYADRLHGTLPDGTPVRVYCNLQPPLKPGEQLDHDQVIARLNGETCTAYELLTQQQLELRFEFPGKNLRDWRSFMPQEVALLLSFMHEKR